MPATTPDPCRPIREYDCCHCDRRGLPSRHVEGEPDGLFKAHVVFQAKHSYRERPPTPNEVFRRVVEEGE